MIKYVVWLCERPVMFMFQCFINFVKHQNDVCVALIVGWYRRQETRNVPQWAVTLTAQLHVAVGYAAIRSLTFVIYLDIHIWARYTVVKSRSEMTIITSVRYQGNAHTHTHARTHTCLTALFPGLPWWAGTRKVKPIWILLKQETVSGSGSGISWAICKSAPRSRQITMPAPHHSVFYKLYALPATQPTASKHWRNRNNRASE